jgi:hypothetical protein
MQVLFRLFRRLFLERLRHAFDMSELRLFFSLAYLPERGQFATILPVRGTPNRLCTQRSRLATRMRATVFAAPTEL